MSIQQETNIELTRERAIVNDLLSNQELGLSALWHELVAGASRILDGFFTDARCYLLVSVPSEPKCSALQGRRLEILESILSGNCQKTVAIELHLAPSTIALNARLGLAALGFEGKPSRAHPLLMLAAKAASDGDLNRACTLSHVLHDGEEWRVVSIARPDARLSELLPPAELAVVRSLIEGQCYREIARRRGTSTRTIANQITAVFRRVRVSGRNDLLQRLFLADPVGRPSPPPPAQTIVPAAAANLQGAVLAERHYA